MASFGKNVGLLHDQNIGSRVHGVYLLFHQINQTCGNMHIKRNVPVCTYDFKPYHLFELHHLLKPRKQSFVGFFYRIQRAEKLLRRVYFDFILFGHADAQHHGVKRSLFPLAEAYHNNRQAEKKVQKNNAPNAAAHQ